MPWDNETVAGINAGLNTQSQTHYPTWGAPIHNPQIDKDALLLQWEAADKALEQAKQIEIGLRNQVLKLMYGPSVDKDGTENIDLGKGYILKAVFKQNFTLDKSDDKVDACLGKLEKSGENGNFIAERLVHWKPHISVAEYKELSDIHKKIIGEVLTIKPGQASLEIIAPKASK